MINLHQEARRLLLSDRYGKFDMIEKIIPAEILNHERPRYIISIICITLNVEESRINRFTFMSWLKRYRKKVKAGIKMTHSIIDDEKFSWRDFQPTVPTVISQTTEKKLIKIVKSKIMIYEKILLQHPGKRRYR